MIDERERLSIYPLQVCSLYTPLLGIVIDNVHLLLTNEKKTNSLSSSRLNENRRKMDERFDITKIGIN